MSSLFDTTSRALSYFLGAGAVTLAAAVILTAQPVAQIAEWAQNVLGWAFVVLLSSLILITLFSWVRMLSDDASDDTVWFETGVQAANGVTTLALTFTLLGISLGIGTLSGQELTPETIQPVIRKMTANFSLGFMTTVIGLPVSALLRGLIVITHARNTAAASAHQKGA
ncbi:MAG: hypothetical protein CMM52_14125 [Rhodospirillaceae bacterium]|nr:hypothetical protein [Rhodospirillaceae bacterium]|tara:strand:+ start:42069 stop:42575 length:507 start_codon:yes stop_codon:yes gene_type:complete